MLWRALFSTTIYSLSAAVARFSAHQTHQTQDLVANLYRPLDLVLCAYYIHHYPTSCILLLLSILYLVVTLHLPPAAPRPTRSCMYGHGQPLHLVLLDLVVYGHL